MRPSASNHYHLTTLWQFDAPLPLVWDAIFDSEGWPRWWKGAERVVTLERGAASGVGARQRYTWKGMLPYRLTFVSHVTRVEPLRLMEGRVEGELEGVGRWYFVQNEGATTVGYDWQVRTNRAWMNLLSPWARPLFQWNHDALMQEGGLGLARHLKARLRAPA